MAQIFRLMKSNLIKQFDSDIPKYAAVLLSYDNTTGERAFGFVLCMFEYLDQRDYYIDSLHMMIGWQPIEPELDGKAPEKIPVIYTQ